MIDEKLKKLRACKEARVWAQGKNWQEIYTTCERGDWLLWLFALVNPDNLRELTLAKAKCARTVFHLMKDKRSQQAVIVAEKFGLGKVTRQELDAAADAADAAADAADAYADAADAAAYAAADADYADAAAAYAAYAAADAAAYAADVYAAARIKNQKQTAGICRKYLPIEIWNIKDES